MAKVSYDIDTSGGLMDQIQKLISPPEESRKKGAESTRRGGRVVSKEACDSCGEGGDLLCCDKCFAAFHLLCHDPPLNEDDVPYGEWLCRQCRSVKSTNVPIAITPPDDAQSTTSSRSNRSNSVASGNNKQRGPRKKTIAGNSVAVPAGRGTPDTSVISRGNDTGAAPEDASANNSSSHPLSRLARDWRNINPREFSLPIVLVPNDLEPTAPIGNGNGQSEGPNNAPTSNNNKRQRISTYAATIAASSVGPIGSSSNSHNNSMGPPHFSSGGPSTPGGSNSSRRRSALPIPAQTSGANYEHQLAVYHSSGPPPAKKPILQPDGNIVSLQPLILCYVCSRSCRSAPLLQCDYCPLAFHLDCLETPLSTFPSSPWMCPNHPEHYLDVAFAPESRQSLSKRIQLWRHYSADAPIDFNAIKLRFLEKLHRPAPPHRSQVKVMPFGSATSLAHVPQAVKAAYNSGVETASFVQPTDDFVQDDCEHLDDRIVASNMRPSLHALVVAGSSIERKKEPSILPSVVEAIMNVVEGKALPSAIASQLDSQTLAELARQRLEQLAPMPTRDDHGDPASTLALKALLELSTGGKTTEDQVNEALLATKRSSARAMFVPVDRGLASSSTLLPIVSKCVSVGTSSKCAINLSQAVQASGCSRVSPLHGVVTHDEMTDTYEMLVYSEHGAVIDGVRFGVGMAANGNVSSQGGEQSEHSRAVAVENGSPQAPPKNKEVPLLKFADSTRCSCSMASEDGRGTYSFDGPAPLRHGSLVQIGCLRFVFARVLLADVKRGVTEISSSSVDCDHQSAMEIA